MRTYLLATLPCLGLAVALAGCSPGTDDQAWHKTGATEGDMNIATYDCTDAANQKFPEIMKSTTVAGYNTESGSGCGFSASSAGTACANGQGNYVQAEQHQVDINQKPRDAFFNQCMMQKGWTQGGL